MLPQVLRVPPTGPCSGPGSGPCSGPCSGACSVISAVPVAVTVGRVIPTILILDTDYLPRDPSRDSTLPITPLAAVLILVVIVADAAGTCR